MSFSDKREVGFAKRGIPNRIITSPEAAPLTSQRPRHPCTPIPPTGPRLRCADAIADRGTSAENPQPIFTMRRSAPTTTREKRGPRPSTESSSRNAPYLMANSSRTCRSDYLSARNG